MQQDDSKEQMLVQKVMGYATEKDSERPKVRQLRIYDSIYSTLITVLQFLLIPVLYI